MKQEIQNITMPDRLRPGLTLTARPIDLDHCGKVLVWLLYLDPSYYYISQGDDDDDDETVAIVK